MTDRQLRFVVPFALAAAALTTSGCSLLAVRGPSKELGDSGPRTQSEQPCTTSGLAPALDVGGAAITGLASVGLAAIAASPCSSGDGVLCGPVRKEAAVLLIPAVAATALLGYSAHQGFTRTRECRELLSAQPAIGRADEALMEAIAASARSRGQMSRASE